jgi:hypothetical protein
VIARLRKQDADDPELLATLEAHATDETIKPVATEEIVAATDTLDILNSTVATLARGIPHPQRTRLSCPRDVATLAHLVTRILLAP